MNKASGIVVAVLVSSACSDAPEQKATAQAVPASLPAGLWKTNAEVTQFKAMDGGRPIMPVKVGDRSEGEACVAAEEGRKPKPVLFGADVGQCSYANFYLGNGTMSGTIDCKTPQGSIMRTVNGSYTADSFEASVDTASYLTSDGDVTLRTKLTGTRAGSCPAS